MTHELRHAFRALLRRPGFTLVAVITVALGIGANTAIFSVVEAVLLRQVPFDDPERLVRLYQLRQADPTTVVEVSYPDLRDWQSATPRMQLAAHASSSGGFVVRLHPTGTAERLGGYLVTHSFFDVLGVEPLFGRLFEDRDDALGAPGVVVLSETLWRRRMGADPDILGRQIEVSGEPRTVIGVVPRGVEYPLGARLWMPVVPAVGEAFVENRSIGFLNPIVRLPPGTTAGAARRELDLLLDQTTNTLLPPAQRTRISLESLGDVLFGDVRRLLWILFGASLLVLLVAAANVANLQTVRAIGRRRELALRTALGAGRSSLLRLGLLEGLLLAAAGGGLGLLCGTWLLRLLLRWSPVELFRGETVGLNGAVFGFATALALLVALLAGLPAALQRSEPARYLRASRGAATPGQMRLLSSSVVAQVALAVVLLLGAALLLRSLQNRIAIDTGFDRQQMMALQVSLFGDRYQEKTASDRFFERLVERVETVPGVKAAAGALMRPLEGPEGFDAPFTLEGQSEEQQKLNPFLNYLAVMPEYFETLGIPLRAGRLLADGDDEMAPPVVVVSESVARRFWPEESALGKRLAWGGPGGSPSWMEVVGVVADARYRSLERQGLDVYVPHRQNSWALRQLVVRSTGDPRRLAGAVREEVRRIDPEVEVLNLATGEDLVRGAVARPRFQTTLLVTYGGLALLLGAVGIFGVLSYSLANGRREVGIRLALGAVPGQILGLTLRRGLAMAGLGVALGLGLGVALTGQLRAALYEVAPIDPLVFLVVPAVLLGSALVASLWPALVASRIEPAEVLRAE